MQEPGKFMNDIKKTNKTHKNFKKCMDILREYHYHFSIKSQQSEMNGRYYNSLSEKTGILDFHWIHNFDKVAFGSKYDQIRHFLISSTLKYWFVAVFHARVLQIYDLLTGAQEYEINMPSCRGIHFLD